MVIKIDEIPISNPKQEVVEEVPEEYLEEEYVEGEYPDEEYPEGDAEEERYLTEDDSN